MHLFQIRFHKHRTWPGTTVRGLWLQHEGSVNALFRVYDCNWGFIIVMLRVCDLERLILLDIDDAIERAPVEQMKRNTTIRIKNAPEVVVLG